MSDSWSSKETEFFADLAFAEKPLVRRELPAFLRKDYPRKFTKGEDINKTPHAICERKRPGYPERLTPLLADQVLPS